MKRTLTLLSLFATASLSFAAPDKEKRNHQGYLGIAMVPIPEVLRSHLQIDDGVGLLIHTAALLAMFGQ